MNLINVNGTVINLDNVVYIDLQPYKDNNKLGLVFVGNETGGYSLVLDDEDAVALRRYLKNNSYRAV